MHDSVFKLYFIWKKNTFFLYEFIFFFNWTKNSIRMITFPVIFTVVLCKLGYAVQYDEYKSRIESSYRQISCWDLSSEELWVHSTVVEVKCAPWSKIAEFCWVDVASFGKSKNWSSLHKVDQQPRVTSFGDIYIVSVILS